MTTMTSTHNRKIKAIVVDDEPPARRNLRALLKGIPDIELVKECGNGRDAVSSIRALEPDLVFLDVQMPEMDGFEVLEQLTDQPLPVIIFVTAYDRYALKAFEVSALDYLLKPFDDARFHKALAQARRQIEQQDASELGRKLLTLMGTREIRQDAPPRYLTRLMVKTAGRVIFIRAEEIDWIEGYDNYVRLHVGGKAHLLRQTMNELEAALNPESVIVGIENIGGADWLASNKKRVYDLTPPGLSVSGSSLNEGGERFLDFIEHELLPAVDHQFRTATPRAFVGVSSGGILATYAAATRSTYRAVVSLDAPIHLGENWLAKKLTARSATAPTPLRYASLEPKFGWPDQTWKTFVAGAPSSWKLYREQL